jgi:hypothetical protein
MSEDEEKKIEEFRERELEEFRKRYLAMNPPIEWADFLMTVPPGTSRGNIQSMYKVHSPKFAEIQEPNITLPCDSPTRFVAVGSESFNAQETMGLLLLNGAAASLIVFCSIHASIARNLTRPMHCACLGLR